jgi:hypothetical protein
VKPCPGQIDKAIQAQYLLVEIQYVSTCSAAMGIKDTDQTVGIFFNFAKQKIEV